MKDLFISFLKENNAYSSFLSEITDSGSDVDTYLAKIPETVFVGCAFNWGFSNEGREYWMNIDSEWTSYLEKNHTK